MAEELTLEALQGIVTNPDTETKVAQAAQLPVGTYNSVPELLLDIKTTGADAKYPNRKYARYFGQFNAVDDIFKTEEDGSRGELLMAKGKGGKRSVSVSWEDRLKDDGKPDLWTKLFYQAKKVYCLANGISPKESVPVADVVQYVQKYAVAVRFLQGDEDNMAVAISAAKEVVPF